MQLENELTDGSRPETGQEDRSAFFCYQAPTDLEHALARVLWVDLYTPASQTSLSTVPATDQSLQKEKIGLTS